MIFFAGKPPGAVLQGEKACAPRASKLMHLAFFPFETPGCPVSRGKGLMSTVPTAFFSGNSPGGSGRVSQGGGDGHLEADNHPMSIA